ncbi:phosphate-starvation-inducible PsiE family protein, partial [Clostridium sp. IBUN13A]
MKRFLREQVMKVADMLETVIGILLAVSIGILVVYLIGDIKSIIMNHSDLEVFNNYLAAAFNLVIGIEFIKMLCKHTPETVIEVLLFAIARQLIVEHTTTMENLVG